MNIAATLTAAACFAVERGMEHCPVAPERLLVTESGGYRLVA